MPHPYIAKSLFAVLACAMTAPLAAQTAPSFTGPSFTGTWKGDVATAKLPAKPDVFAIRNGRYTCSTCTPAVAVKADGTAQPAAGHDYWDHLAVKVVDPNTIAYTYSRGGKVVSSSTDILSPNGKTLTTQWRSTNNASGVEQTGTLIATRVGPAPTGAHAASGSWRQAAIKQLTDSNLIITFKDDGDALTLQQPTGEHYTAKFGGPAVPIVGDPVGTMAKVRRINARTIEEVDSRGGKPVYTYTMTLAPDGKSMTVVNSDLKAGTKTQFVAYRQ